MHMVLAHQRLGTERQGVGRTLASHPTLPVPERDAHLGGDPVLHVPHHRQHGRRPPAPFGIIGAGSAAFASHGLRGADDQDGGGRGRLTYPPDLLSQQPLVGGGIQQVVKTLIGAIGDDDQIRR
jgi:hypothetical protein